MNKSNETKICLHLKPVYDYVQAAGGGITYQGNAWSKNCRLWIYFDVVLDCSLLKSKLNLNDCIEIHEHIGTHDGQERGFVCKIHQDGIMGIHPKFATGEKTIE